MKQEWALIANLQAGHKTSLKKWEKVQALLSAAGIEYVPFYTNHVGHAREQAIAVLEKGYRYIAVMGGDGTISEVVDGVMKSGVDTTQVVIGLLPFGTGNDWARYWKIKKVSDAVRCLANMNTSWVDVGKAQFDNPQPTLRYFINAIGFGFDARVIQITNRVQRWFKGQAWTYSLSLFMAVLKHHSQYMQFEADSWKESFKCYTVSVGNGAYTGGGIRQTPLATPFDGKLDVMAMGSLSFVTIVKAIGLLFRGKLLAHPSVRFQRVEQLCVSSNEVIVSEVDGILQPLTHRFTISIVPRALRFVCP